MPEPAGTDVAMRAAMLGTLISMPFFSYMLRVVDCRSSGQGALWGLAVAVCLDSGLNVSHGLFEDRPFALFVLHRGYHIVSLTLVGCLLGLLCT